MQVIGKTTCPYCGVGCGVDFPVNEWKEDIRPLENNKNKVCGDAHHPANFGRLCVKGSNLIDTLGLDGRLLHPVVKGKQASWDTALDTISTKIKQVVEEHGPDAFAFYLSGQILTEDYYVANKLAKGFIGTANVDTNSRLCMASAVVGYKRAFGTDTVPCCYEDLEQCDLLIMIGSNAAWTHPVLFQRISAAKQKRPEMKVVVIDPRETATCDIADLHLAITPGSDALIFSTLLVESERRGKLDSQFINDHTNGFKDTVQAARASSPSIESAAQEAGISVNELSKLVEWWCQTERSVSFYSQGVNQSSSGVDKANAIINCHLATGRIGREGMGPFSITGQPNAMGGREVGGLANQLAAHMDFATPGAIDLVQQFWQAPKMATQNGLKAVDMFQAIEEGKVKVVWIMSTNPMVSLPDTNQVRRALEKCELVIVSDCQMNTDTAAMADVLLPATTWSEKDGTVTNSERRISRQRGLLPAPGEAKHDWWAMCEVAKRMGFMKAFNYASPNEIFIEHAALSAFENAGPTLRDFDIGGLSTLSKPEYDALSPIQWPVTPSQPQGTKRMFEDGLFFTPDRKARFIPITPKAPVERPSEQWPLVLNTGRLRDQWHTMTRTGKASILLNHSEQPYVEMSPSDAERLAVKDKTLVKLSSRVGEVLMRAKINEKQKSGNVFVPIHWTNQYNSANVISSLVPQVFDPLSGQPESKHACVNLEPVECTYYGYALALNPLELSAFDYWSDVTIPKGKRYEVAIKLPLDLSSLVHKAVYNKSEQSASSGDIECLTYTNPITNEHRFAFITKAGSESRLVAAFYFSPLPNLPDSRWLTSLFEREDPLNTSERIALLAGLPADVEDKGDIICSCFQVGSKQIEASIHKGCRSAEALGDSLKCGTNCGSCIPELKALIESTSTTSTTLDSEELAS
ncbi:molybdopterin-dependent oxidoreductase [Marinomonas mediterranea]|uniref:nitrate reductase n=1 Tax=Marinomonas mediterranea TaxID=119864 RepID=UPI0023497ECA|nr:nitrate reductase [Marinomonas mediterranea]WCN15039.1 molybdopterin-dependent oxidoreductase [Marinomonas mediterranea]